MKKLLVTMMATLACVGAFGQGAVNFQLDSNHAIYFTADTSMMLPADAATMSQGLLIAGQGAYTGDYLGSPGTIASLAGSPTFIAALYGGPNAGSLTLQTTTGLGDVNNEGNVSPFVPCYPGGIPGGTQWTWEVQVFSGINPALGSGISSGALAAWAAGNYAGTSGTFLATLGSAVAPPISDSTPVGSGGAGSTWANGTAELTDYPTSAGGPFGAIAIYASPVPEPGTFALAGLGLAALLVFRRRS